MLRLPQLSGRFIPVWRRNLLVWRKLAIASILGNIADPLLYMLALGYGLGSLVGEVGGMSYVAFIGTGMVCQSAMFTASFEGMYSAFSRMHMQRTWEAIINAPLSLDDVVFAEWIWAASKAVVSTGAILAVIDHGTMIACDTPQALLEAHVEPEVVEVYGEDARAWATARGRALSNRLEIAGETAFCYATDAAPLLADLATHAGVRYLHRPANLEDLFIKLTGRELRD